MRTLLLLLLLVLSVPFAAAQDASPSEASAFLNAMAYVPTSPLVTAGTPMVSYVDYRASILARGLDIPADWAAFAASEMQSTILFALPNAGPTYMLQSLMSGGPRYEQTIGVDFFDIHQAVEVGMPPAQGQILIGDINPLFVVTIYALRGYTAEERDGGTLLCPKAGCDTGTRVSLADRDPANPFGGMLGRSELAFVADGIFLNSPSLDMMEALIATYTGDAPSLADNIDVQAFDALLNADPYVSSVVLFTPLDFGAMNIAAMLGNISEEIIARLRSTLELEPLPLYSLVGVASVSSEDAQYGLTLISYDDADIAADAARIIDSRLEAGISMVRQVPYVELLNGDIGTLEQPSAVITDDATGRSVVTLRIASDVPPVEQVNGRNVMSHQPFKRLLDMIYSRDTIWLLWGSADE